MSNQTEIIDRLLDKGITLSYDSNDLCCPDCLQTSYSSIVPASPMLTTHEINDGNYRIYVLASVETAAKYFEFAGLTIQYGSNPSDRMDCCLHFEASFDTSLKLGEALGYDIPNNFKSCSTNFNSCIDELLSLFNADETDRILDKGIVEYGSISGQSKVCALKNFVNLAYNTQDKVISTKAEILYRFLDKGIVVSCYNGEMTISSGETFLKWYEGYITNTPI